MAEMPDVAQGAVIADDWGNDIRDRTIQRYANVTERTTLHPTPAAGDMAFMEDADLLYVYSGSAWLPVGTTATVHGRVQDLTGSGISTTETVEMTANLSIPATWNSYDVEAILTLELFESGALTNDRLVTCRLRLTNAAGTEIGLTNHTLDTFPAAGFRNPVAVAGYVTGQTATGTLPIVFTAQIAGDSGQASWDNGTLLATAYRVT